MPAGDHRIVFGRVIDAAVLAPTGRPMVYADTHVLDGSGDRVECTEGGKLAVRHMDCGALNEVVPYGMSEDGRDLYKVVGEVKPVR